MVATEQATHDRAPRIARRVDARCELVTTTSDRPIGSHCMALSVRGVWLETNATVEANDDVIVCFTPPRRTEPLMLLGRVSCRCCDPRLLSRRCPPGGSSVAIKFEPLDATEESILAECVRGFPPPLPSRPAGPTYVPSVAWRNGLSKPPPPPRRPLRSEPLRLQPLLEPERPRRRGGRTGLVMAALVVLFATGALGAVTARDRFRPHHATATISKSALTREAPTPRLRKEARLVPLAQHGAVAAESFDRETIEARAAALAQDALAACIATPSPAELGLVVRLAPTGYPVGVALTDTAFAYTREGQCIARRMMALRAPPFAGQPLNLPVRVRAR